jgi:hypothetical protein
MADLHLPVGLSLTGRQEAELRRLLLRQQQERHWHGRLPVMLLDRCWLRLETVEVARLASVLPPDSTAEAPELVRFRHWLQEGFDPLQAEARCWQEFGAEACREALRRHWLAQDQGNHGWTLMAYLQVLRHYRGGLERSMMRPLPLIVLARPGSREVHCIHWLVPSGSLDAAHLPPD